MTTTSRPTPTRGRPSPNVLSWVMGIVAVLLVLVPLVVGLYTDWLWFGELDFRSVFTTQILARIALFVIFALVGGGVAWLACLATWRGRPQGFQIFELDSPLSQYRTNIENSVRGILVAVPVIVGVLTGFLGQGSWRTVLLFFNRQDFGRTDPQFGLDYGFYAFTLPMLQLIVSVLGILFIGAFLISLAGNYVLGGIRIGNRLQGIKGHFSTEARKQMAIIAGLWMLTQVASYWLQRYSLLYTRHELFTGGGYTDINAQLPARIILMVISVVVAIAFFTSYIYRDLRVPAMGVVLMLVSAVVIGRAWPMIMEQFSVKPNRQAKEQEYIARNIEATRYAYGVTDEDVTYLENWGADTVADEAVAQDKNTIANLRLLDPDLLSPTFTQMQQLRNFYGFPDTLQMDRYQVDSQMRDFVVAARELDPNALRDNQLDWINRHTVYTHGNGFVAARANTVDEAPQEAGSTRGGFPLFTVSDLQNSQDAPADAAETSEEVAAAAKNQADADTAEDLGITVDQPRIYYGPVIASAADGADYAIVGNEDAATNYEYDTDTTQFTYDGSGGVGIGNIVNQAAYALKYQELNFLLSDRVNGESKILYDRDPRERVQEVAPWLTTDQETYPAVVDGRIKWIVDGYTTLAQLPYSQRTSLTTSTQDSLNPDGTTQSLINDEVGYIRNSVKATVDAYDGTVELYEFDTEDPVLKAWMGVFPDTVKPASEISDELREHFRYPMDLFRVQREVLARYHVDDPRVFFNNDAFWSVPRDPTADQELDQPPYYVLATDPQNPQNASFQLITPFRGLNREFLSAHMTVTADPENYGKITVRVLPTDTQTQGPRQAQDAMMSSDQVARDRTLWQGTNNLYNGNLLALPVGGGEILYVEPIYSQRSNQDSAFPKLLRVLVSYKGRVGYAPTIAQALDQVGIDPQSAQAVAGDAATTDSADSTDAKKDEEKTKEAAAKEATTNQPATGSGAEGEAIEKINTALRGLDNAKNGSFEEYGKALDELDAAVAEYQKAAK